jgi:hypothetical protein
MCRRFHSPKVSACGCPESLVPDGCRFDPAAALRVGLIATTSSAWYARAPDPIIALVRLLQVSDETLAFRRIFAVVSQFACVFFDVTAIGVVRVRPRHEKFRVRTDPGALNPSSTDEETRFPQGSSRSNSCRSDAGHLFAASIRVSTVADRASRVSVGCFRRRRRRSRS